MPTLRSSQFLGRAPLGLVLVLAFLLFAPALALARQLSLPLRNGETVSGELISLFPGDRLTLRLSTGQLRTVRWQELRDPDTAFASISPGPPEAATPPPNEAPSAAPPAAAPPPNEAPSAAVPAPPGQVLVHIESNRPGTALLRYNQSLIANGFGFRGAGVQVDVVSPTCFAPCDQPVDTQAFYRIGGLNITPSRAFILPSDGPLSLKVRAGSLARIRGGVAATFLGIGLAGLGGALIGVGINSRTTNPLDPDPFPSGGFVAGGGVLVGIGGAALITGIALWASSGTRVTIDRAPRLGRIGVSPQGFTF